MEMNDELLLYLHLVFMKIA